MVKLCLYGDQLIRNEFILRIVGNFEKFSLGLARCISKVKDNVFFLIKRKSTSGSLGGQLQK